MDGVMKLVLMLVVLGLTRAQSGRWHGNNHVPATDPWQNIKNQPATDPWQNKKHGPAADLGGAKKGKASGDWSFLLDDQNGVPGPQYVAPSAAIPPPTFLVQAPRAASAAIPPAALPKPPSPEDDPNPVPVNPEMLTGYWYTQVFKVPCKWNGAKAFTNFEQIVTLNQNILSFIDTWRTDECITTRAKMYPTNKKGVFVLKDNVGDQISGDYAVVAIEPNCFHVAWGCLSRDPLTNRCQDHWVVGKTRARNPDAASLGKLDLVLRGIGVNEYDLIDQSHRTKCCGR